MSAASSRRRRRPRVPGQEVPPTPVGLEHELRSRTAAIVGSDVVEQVRIVVAPR